METREEILNKLKELKPKLHRDYAVKDIGLFGSFSDDTYSDESDIDLLVELEKPIDWKFFTMELYLEKMLGRKFDLVTQNALKEQLREDILNKVKYL